MSASLPEDRPDHGVTLGTRENEGNQVSQERKEKPETPEGQGTWDPLATRG